MLPERKALGKGLSSLIPLGHRSENVSGKYFECNIDDIVPNQNQPRKLFDKNAIDELAASINEKGIIKNKSYIAYKSYVPWLRGMNFRVFAKPLSYASTSAADLLLQD